MTRIALITACCFAVLALPACGNKGDLVLAETPPVEAAPTPEGEVPVELAPEAATGMDPATNPSTDTLEDAGTGDTSDAPPVGANPAEPPTPVPGRG